MILEKINKQNDIKKINPTYYPLLANEIREFLIDKLSKTGGHLASNLGVVELTMALHIVFNLPKDKIIWDVGHQSYIHKILTGRKDGFNRLRKFGGMSGFPKRAESECDAFDTGHSTTSISAGLGFAVANKIKGNNSRVISVIGDGALTGGMAYEALNNVSSLKGNFIIVLNDNEMSIAPNVGAVSNVLNEIRISSKYNLLKKKINKKLSKFPKGLKLVNNLKKVTERLKKNILPGEIIESLGITYFGPIDGHDIKKLIKTFNLVSKMDKPVFVHVVTKKGKGYKNAENNPYSYHGVSPKFDKDLKKSKPKTYASHFSDTICDLAYKNKKIVGITAAMPDGVGLDNFSKEFPNRFFDVGIAEQHAVTFAAGLAAAGMKPVFGVYSSFLQRAYDQILHDVCIQNLNVVFAIDHAGLVGSDGETHQGIFDLSYLSSIPNMTIFSPKNAQELIDGTVFAINEFDRPIALRYPSGKATEVLKEFRTPIVLGKSEMIYEEKDIAIITVGRMIEMGILVREKLKANNYNASLINARFIKPFDKEMIRKLAKTHKLMVTIEENVLSGGYGEHICEYVMDATIKAKVLPIALPNAYIEHGNVNILLNEAGINVPNIVKRIESAYLYANNE